MHLPCCIVVPPSAAQANEALLSLGRAGADIAADMNSLFQESVGVLRPVGTLGQELTQVPFGIADAQLKALERTVSDFTLTLNDAVVGRGATAAKSVMGAYGSTLDGFAGRLDGLSKTLEEGEPLDIIGAATPIFDTYLGTPQGQWLGAGLSRWGFPSRGTTTTTVSSPTKEPKPSDKGRRLLM